VNYQPTLEQVLELAQRSDNNLVPVFRDVPADLETPVSAFLKVAKGDHSFLFESVEGGERLARYSFIGTEPYRVYKSGPYVDPKDGVDPLIEVEAEMSRYKLSHPKDSEARTSLPRFTGGAVGFLAYDVIRHFEPRVTIPSADSTGLPEALFMFVDSLLVFDHVKHVIKVVAHCRLDGDVEASYRQACWRIEELAKRLNHALPASPYPTALYHEHAEAESNVGHDRYIEMVQRCKSTSSPATSSRLCRRNGCRGRRLLIRSRSTGPCVPLTLRPTCSTCRWATRTSSARRRKCWCGSKMAWSKHIRSLARCRADATPTKTPRSKSA